MARGKKNRSRENHAKAAVRSTFAIRAPPPFRHQDLETHVLMHMDTSKIKFVNMTEAITCDAGWCVSATQLAMATSPTILFYAQRTQRNTPVFTKLVRLLTKDATTERDWMHDDGVGIVLRVAGMSGFCPNDVTLSEAVEHIEMLLQATQEDQRGPLCTRDSA